MMDYNSHGMGGQKRLLRIAIVVILKCNLHYYSMSTWEKITTNPDWCLLAMRLVVAKK